MKVGLFGGSFNPIHNGHIALAKAVREQCGLDEVWLMVSPQNPLKQGSSDLLDDELRLEMAQKALEGVEGVKACDYEMHLPKPSYTWTTLQALSKDFPDHRFTLLIGGDNWAHFQRWRHWQDILWHHDIIVYPRDEHPGTIDVPLLDVSSTEIRKRVANGESIDALVPKSIVPLVLKNYQSPQQHAVKEKAVPPAPHAQGEDSYSPEELTRLHEHLYKITAEVIRICEKHGLSYFLIGGSAIGAYYWQGIIPWDDDIDIGMPRQDYERFLEVAPQELSEEFFLQHPGTEPHTPFWFAKVRENGTLYVEGHFRHLKIHHGIFVDVFPFDEIPQSKLLEQLQYHAFGFLHACFIGKEVWQWRHAGRCEVDEPLPRGFLGCWATRIIDTLLSKQALFRLLRFVQTFFNGKGNMRCKNIMTKSDIVPLSDINPPQQMPFGPLSANVPQHLKEYLLTHYGHIQKDLPKEQQINHKPYRLMING